MYAQKRWYMVSVYSAAHLLVDFACAFMMFRGLSGADDWQLCLLLYNFCAFAMQLPLGLLADRWGRNTLLAAAGCLLVGAAFGLWAVPVAAAVTAGLGNGLFHVGGGVDILNISGARSGALGIFISPGALGIYWGALLGSGQTLGVAPAVLALGAAGALILTIPGVLGGGYAQNAPLSLSRGPWQAPLAAALCLFGVVCLRSYVGLTVRFPWKSPGLWSALLVCAVALGKGLGGLISDRLGPLKTASISLGAAALLLPVAHIPAAGLAAMLLFNMTMPITLWAMAGLFPGAKGFSFGLLTFGLFLGFLPVHLGAASVLKAPWHFALAAALSLALLGLGLKRARL